MREKIPTIIAVTILILMIAFLIGFFVKYAVDEDFHAKMKVGFDNLIGYEVGYDDTADIMEYILSDTEDQGDYIISITRASAKVAEFPNARFYFVEFIDADGDYEHLIVRVDKDGIHEFNVEE